MLAATTPTGVAPWRGAALAVALAAVALPAAPALAEEDGATDGTPDPATDQVVEDPAVEEAVEPIVFADTEGLALADAVHALADAGVVKGCEEGRFCPYVDVTRGQVATMLAGALGLEPLPDGPFGDIEGSPHEEQINAIEAAGIVNGCEDDAYCPGEPLTREQLATMLVRAFELPETTVIHFEDATAVHGENVHRLAEAGIAAGCGDPLTHFCSRSSVARVHVAAFLARAMELIPRVELAPLDERRELQAAIDAEREAAREAERRRQAELEAERQRQEEMARVAAERLAMWERLAQCESGGNWSINTGNGYYGGLQFLLQTWRYVGGTGYPHQATKEEQIYRAERLLEYSWASFGNQWPACSRRLGLS